MYNDVCEDVNPKHLRSEKSETILGTVIASEFIIIGSGGFILASSLSSNF